MPSRTSSGPKVPDPKSRKLTDFWGKSEIGSSSPAASTSHSQSQTRSLKPASPVKSTAASSSGGTSSRTASNAGPFAGSFSLHSFTPRKSGASLQSPSKGTPSPRKYIMVEDDDNDEEPPAPMAASRKRPREPATTTSVSSKDSTSSASSPPNVPIPTVIDLTGSPPHKRRALDASNQSSGNKRHSLPTISQKVSSQRPTSFTQANASKLSLEIIEPIRARSNTNSNTVPNNTQSILPTPITPGLSTPNVAGHQNQTVEDRTRAKIEEIKRKAEMRLKGVPVSIPSRAIKYTLIEDSDDDDDDPLDRMKGAFAAKKNIPVAPTKKAVEKPRMKSPTPTAAEIFSSSSLTDLDSEDSPQKRPIIKKMAIKPGANKASTTLPPPKSALQDEGITIKPRAAMPLALSMLLKEDPKTKTNEEAIRRQKLLKAVEEDMKEMERRRIYGDDDDDARPLRDVDPSVTEMALGEEQAHKINRIIASDDSARLGRSPWRPFWDEQLVGAHDTAMDTTCSIPPLSAPGSNHPILSRLQKMILENEISQISFFLQSGFISSLPADVSKRLAPWLFRLACSCEVAPNLAVAAEVAFCSLFSTSGNKITECPLLFSDMIGPVLLLGPLRTVIESIFADSAAMPMALPRDPITRDKAVCRFIRMISSMSRAGVYLCEPTNTMVLLSLLYLEPSTQTEVRRDISLISEDVLQIMDSQTLHSFRTQELDVCKCFVSLTTDFRLVEKRQLLLCIFGGQPGPRRFMRWFAVGMLLPDMIQDLHWEDYIEPPSLDRLAQMFDFTNDFSTPFQIGHQTDYEELFYYTEILGSILTDVSQFQPAQASQLERIVTGLDVTHNKISDSRAAFLDRTRAKDALQRLRIRVHFQLQQTSSRATTIDSMFNR